MPTLIPEKFRQKSADRVGYIMGLYAMRNPSAPSAKEKKNAIAILGTKIDDSDVTDEEIKGFKSQLEIETEEENGGEGETLASVTLSRAEKARLKLEVDGDRWNRGRQSNVWLVPV